MAKSFKVGEHEYQAGRLSVFEQNHVARRYGGVLIFLGAMQSGPDGKVIDAKKYARAMVGASAQISNEDVDYAIGACLSVVQRKQGAIWAPMRAGNGALMFNDISLVELMELIYNVLQENGIIDFFYVAPSDSNEPGPKVQA